MAIDDGCGKTPGSSLYGFQYPITWACARDFDIVFWSIASRRWALNEQASDIFLAKTSITLGTAEN